MTYLTWGTPPEGVADFAAAKAEAERLSKQSPGKKIAVVKIVGYCLTPAPAPEWHEADVPAEPAKPGSTAPSEPAKSAIHIPTPFELGGLAFVAGVCTRDCPFPVGSEQHEGWVSGWMEEQTKHKSPPAPHMYERKKNGAAHEGAEA